MRFRSALAIGVLALTASLVACASGATTSGAIGTGTATEPPQASESAVPAETADAAALEQAQAWLEAATLPPGAFRSEESISGFTSYTGWPCGPVEELEAFWTISDATVPDTANWLMQNPTANLITTAVGPVSGAAGHSAIVGYIPELGAQEGIVYTVLRIGDGVAVRAEIAALTESAGCPPRPDGGMYGAPGQG